MSFAHYLFSAKLVESLACKVLGLILYANGILDRSDPIQDPICYSGIWIQGSSDPWIHIPQGPQSAVTNFQLALR